MLQVLFNTFPFRFNLQTYYFVKIHSNRMSTKTKRQYVSSALFDNSDLVGILFLGGGSSDSYIIAQSFGIDDCQCHWQWNATHQTQCSAQ